MSNQQAGVAHCTLSRGKITKAVAHKTVSEFWHILSGRGQIWRRNNQEESITDLMAGITIDIPLGTEFQYRNDTDADLVFICFTFPSWSGADEAYFVENSEWVPTA
jgi:mannose-6-phosphate isomerase-like protein (cupin superfamily)